MQKPERWLLILIIMVVLIGGARPLSQYCCRQFLNHHQAQIEPLIKKLNREHFQADISGQEIRYQRVARLQNQLTGYYQNPIPLHLLSWLHKSKLIADPILKREVEMVYLDYLGNQGDSKQVDQVITEQTLIAKTFTVYRPSWRDHIVSNQKLKQVLVTSTTESDLDSAWLAGCQIGAEVGPRLLKLVKLRNQLAREQGYRDFFQLQLAMNQQSEQELDSIFNQVDIMTRDAYQQQKAAMDKVLARRFGIPAAELKPWHYQQIFLQQVPVACEPNLDKYYARKDIIPVVSQYFRRLGLPANQVIGSSDLKPRAAKYPYAYCIDIDRAGDVRILANLQNDADSTQTLLHEMGHAVYDLKIAPSLPWRLREPASTGLTEGVAMMFGDRYADPAWLQYQLGLSGPETKQIAEDCQFSSQLNNLIFCRWALVMYHFEKEMYAHPDTNLDSFWWQLVKRYQLINPPIQPPAYAWAAKVHLATAPVYYYHYLLGRIIAYQLTEGWEMELAKPSDNSPLGTFLSECIFAPGARLQWEDVLYGATGEKINPQVLGVLKRK